MAQSAGVLAAIAGTACLLVALSIIIGITVNVVQKGEDHKEQMMASPPPPPASARRELFESNNLFQPPKDHGFKLKPSEKSAFASLSHRPLKR